MPDSLTDTTSIDFAVSLIEAEPWTPTPLLQAHAIGQRLDADVWLKREDCTPIGSFKLRGAVTTAGALASDVPEAGVYVASAGNYGLAIVYACARYGIPVTVVAPEGATPSKLERIRLLGGTVEIHGDDFDVAKSRAKEKAREAGGVFWEDGVIEEMATGAGTIATELLQHPEPWDMVVVPLGNGSLIKGIAQEMKRRSPSTKTIGVVPDGAPSMAQALRGQAWDESAAGRHAGRRAGRPRSDSQDRGGACRSRRRRVDGVGVGHSPRREEPDGARTGAGGAFRCNAHSRHGRPPGRDSGQADRRNRHRSAPEHVSPSRNHDNEGAAMSAKDIRNVAVVGAGLMGHSIAQEFAVAGCQVALNDVSEERLGHARERIRQNLEMLGRSQEVDEVESRMTFTGDLRMAVEDADLVVEAITEDLEIKRALFAELEGICREDAILASNTSTFMPSQLAEATKNPGRVLVTHYFNPPHVVPLVEVVGGRDTSPETIETVRDLLLSQGKKPVVLGTEALGFIANRLQAALLRECFALVENGVARPEDIDTVVTTSLGRRLGVAGPFEVFDAAGADVWHAIFEGLAHDIESSTEVPPGIARMVERGDFGLKTGRGVYEWSDESSAELRRRIARAVEEIGRWNDGE